MSPRKTKPRSSKRTDSTNNLAIFSFVYVIGFWMLVAWALSGCASQPLDLPAPLVRGEDPGPLHVRSSTSVSSYCGEGISWPECTEWAFDRSLVWEERYEMLRAETGTTSAAVPLGLSGGIDIATVLLWGALAASGLAAGIAIDRAFLQHP